jgi:hypothetical protein
MNLRQVHLQFKMADLFQVDIYSLRSLSHDRSIASSKASSTQIVI